MSGPRAEDGRDEDALPRAAFDDFTAFRAALPPRGALLGFDLGTKTLGIAVSDIERTVASAETTLRRRKFSQDAAAIVELLEARDAVGIVLGLPLNMDGGEGPRAQSTRAFARNLGRWTATPIAFWDERLSTVAVERTLLEADASRARRAEIVDKLAAAYILQGALDRLSALARADGAEPNEGTA